MESNPTAPPEPSEPWIVRHFAIVLYSWFFFGMFLCGLLAPPERVAELGSGLISAGWHLSVLALALALPVLAIYRRRLQDRPEE